MPDIERELGRVAGSLDALREEVKDFRTESLAAFAQINARLRPLETQDAIEDHIREHIARKESHGHSWKQIVLLVLTSVVTSIITAWSTIYAGSFGK